MRENIKKLVVKILSEVSQESVTSIPEDADLIISGILDSMGFLTFATKIQEQLDIELPFDKYLPEEFTILEKFITICENALNKN